MIMNDAAPYEMDTSTPVKRLVFNVLVSIALFDREIMLTCQREVIESESGVQIQGPEAVVRFLRATAYIYST